MSTGSSGVGGSRSSASRIGTITRLELRKVVVTRGSAALLSATLGLGLLLALGALLVARRLDGAQTEVSVPLVTLSLAVAVAAPLIGVLIMTSDWQSREIMTTFLLEPRPGPRVLGKARVDRGAGAGVHCRSWRDVAGPVRRRCRADRQ